MNAHSIRRVETGDPSDLIGGMRAYCDFYEASPADVDLLALARVLLDDPREGAQLIARDADCRAMGFATV
ncbi:MAG: hypothetical protein ACRDPA_03495 [Solirubrobacteraceae bacterium]